MSNGLKTLFRQVLCLTILAQLGSADEPVPRKESGHRTIHLFDGAPRRVVSLAFSPDGKSLAASNVSGLVKLLNVETGEELQGFKVPGGWAYSVAYSPDGKTLAIGGGPLYYGAVKLYDVATAKLVWEQNRIKGTNFVIIAFSPDGKLLAGGAHEDDSKRPAAVIRLWNAKDGTLMQTLKGSAGEVFSLAFSPDGKSLVSTSADDAVLMWSVETGDLRHTLKGHGGRFPRVAYSPDGKSVARCSYRNEVDLWDAASGELVRTFGASRRTSSKPGDTSIAFSTDGKYLAVGGFGFVRIWEVATGLLKRMMLGENDPPDNNPDMKCISYSPDGKYLAVGGSEGVQLWNCSDLLKVAPAETGLSLATALAKAEYRSGDPIEIKITLKNARDHAVLFPVTWIASPEYSFTVFRKPTTRLDLKEEARRKYWGEGARMSRGVGPRETRVTADRLADYYDLPPGKYQAFTGLLLEEGRVLHSNPVEFSILDAEREDSRVSQ